MRWGVRRIAIRFALLLGLCGHRAAARLRRAVNPVAPAGTRTSVVEGNGNVAARGEEVRRYVRTYADLLKALGADLQNTGLQQWQQDRIIKNFVLQFPEFREITLFDIAGTSSHERTGVRGRPSRATSPTMDGVGMSPTSATTSCSRRRSSLRRCGSSAHRPAGWWVSSASRALADGHRIRIGDQGYAMVLAPSGELLAHGAPDKRRSSRTAQPVGAPAGRRIMAGADVKTPIATSTWTKTACVAWVWHAHASARLDRRRRAADR